MLGLLLPPGSFGATVVIRAGDTFLNPQMVQIGVGDSVQFLFVGTNEHRLFSPGLSLSHIRSGSTIRFTEAGTTSFSADSKTGWIYVSRAFGPSPVDWQEANAPQWLYTALATGGGASVAVGVGSRIISSTNGVDWTQELAPAPSTHRNLRGVAFGKGRFVANTEDSLLLTSTDGKTWSQLDQQGGGYAVRFVNNHFVALGRNLLTSENGLNWSVSPLQPQPGVWLRDIAYGEGKYVLIENWATRVTTDLFDQGTMQGNGTRQAFSVAYGAGSFATEHRTSDDGTLWRPREVVPGGHEMSYANGLFFSGQEFAVDAQRNVTDLQSPALRDVVFDPESGRLVATDSRTIYVSMPVRRVAEGEALTTINGAFTFDDAITAISPAEARMKSGYNDGVVFYTLDGSTPSTDSALYTGPLSLTNSVTIRTLALSPDFSARTEAPPLSVIIVPGYALNVATEGPGVVVRSPLSDLYKSNDVITLTAHPDPGAEFLGWSAASGLALSIDVTLNSNKTVHAVFRKAPSYPLTIEGSGGGTHHISPLQDEYLHGATVTATATPDNGFTFLAWGGTTNSESNPLTLQMIEPTVLRPTFGTALAISQAQNGTIEATPLKPVYAYGEEVRLTAIPDPGFRFVGWGGTLMAGTNSASVVMPIIRSNPTVFALFTSLDPGEVTLTTRVIGPGNVLITQEKKAYQKGETVNLSAIPGTNALFVKWNGDASTDQPSAVVTMNESKVITAEFVRPKVQLEAAIAFPTGLDLTVTTDTAGSVTVDHSIDAVTWLPYRTISFSSPGRTSIHSEGEGRRTFYRARQTDAI